MHAKLFKEDKTVTVRIDFKLHRDRDIVAEFHFLERFVSLNLLAIALERSRVSGSFNRSTWIPAEFVPHRIGRMLSNR